MVEEGVPDTFQQGGAEPAEDQEANQPEGARVLPYQCQRGDLTLPGGGEKLVEDVEDAQRIIGIAQE